jgi:glucan phosphoethanolaminetransferase (alkaline phosphatase superfamily)
MNTESKKIKPLIALLIISLIAGISPWLKITYIIEGSLEQIHYFSWCWILSFCCALLTIIKVLPLRKTRKVLVAVIVLLSTIAMVSALSYGVVRWAIGILVQNMPYG